MSDTRAILEDAVNGLFTEHVTPELLRRAESGAWPQKLWDAIEELGLAQLFTTSDDPWRDAAVVLKACGRHALPVPLAEHVLATGLLAHHGIQIPDGIIGLASGHRISGALVATGGRKIDHLVFGDNSAIFLAPMALANRNHPSPPTISREPYARISLSGKEELTIFAKAAKARSKREEILESNDGTLIPGAMMRAAQIAGALERVLALTVQYAKDRVQFGKSIGAYQAIQQQLAILATQSAAATRAVDAAFEAAARGGDIFLDAAVAKIRAGEAATIATGIAHQVHGAIGFTDEHTLHYFTRRLWTWRTEFGSESYWSKRLGAHALTEFGADGLWPAVTNAR